MIARPKIPEELASDAGLRQGTAQPLELVAVAGWPMVRLVAPARWLITRVTSTSKACGSAASASTSADAMPSRDMPLSTDRSGSFLPARRAAPRPKPPIVRRCDDREQVSRDRFRFEPGGIPFSIDRRLRAEATQQNARSDATKKMSQPSAASATAT
jgi:hypothetical protein